MGIETKESVKVDSRADVITDNSTTVSFGVTNVASQVGETMESNEYGVLFTDIIGFVNDLNLRLGMPREIVLAKLKFALTPDKLTNLRYWQLNGHQLDVTGVNAKGELEFDSCSEESPLGAHRAKTYFEALELAVSNGANLMSLPKRRFLALKGINLDVDSGSWLFTPNVDSAGNAYYSYRLNDVLSMPPTESDENIGFRVSLTV